LTQDDPLGRFRELLSRAQSIEELDPRVMAVATTGADGTPSVRMMLLQRVDERGFVFFSTYTSRKGRELARQPRAGLCFHWPSIAVQVCAEGCVERTSPEESNAYFDSRPRSQQLAVWASSQSAPLASRSELLTRHREVDARYAERTIPRPEHFGGYRLVPERVEFWHGYEHRLHDRVVYVLGAEGWSVHRLFP
jgi:pyridoxamine 5'-phosphate oxidase